MFVDPENYLSREQQRAHYLTHENGPQHPGYVAFLRRLVDPMLPHLAPGMHGVDFGCGPGPAIATILAQYGITCANYDPFFEDTALSPPYDYIFSSECFEHFEQPGQEIRRLHEMLKPGGHLAVMTECWQELDAFASWYYTRDPTHVVFFHARTFAYLCRTLGFTQVEVDDSRVTILRKL